MSQSKQRRCLEAIELSLSRYKRWKRERQGCGIKELKACPKYSRNQLTFSEITTMREFVTSPQYAHYPVRSLHHLAKREGILFCTYTTWVKYINHYEWLRPRKKKRKKYERIGIRADQPNKVWHLDVSYFIFPDGRKAFIQAIIDNYSRYVLAWQVIPSYDGAKTGALLQKALQRSNAPTFQPILEKRNSNPRWT
jgi:transposase InsO family protein